MVMQWTVNPPPFGHDWFDPSILHHNIRNSAIHRVSPCVVTLLLGPWAAGLVNSSPHIKAPRETA